MIEEPVCVTVSPCPLQGQVIEYHGDPLKDFTLMRFLDRFVYKNPKQKESDHGGSLMQVGVANRRGLGSYYNLSHLPEAETCT